MVFSFFRKKNRDDTKPGRQDKRSPKTPHVAPQRSDSFGDSIGTYPPQSGSGIVVNEATAESAVIEEAAIFYANGQIDHAQATLIRGIQEHAGPGSQRLWLMLLDLYQIRGMKAEHEELAVEFVVKFERSAPPWRENDNAHPVPKAMQTGGVSYFALNGRLDSSIESQLDQVGRIIKKSGMLRFDLGKVTAIEATGCALLRKSLQSLRRTEGDFMLSHSDHLETLLRTHITDNKSEASKECWLLLLELYQTEGRQNEFDDLALEFAMAYELSPPSWEGSAHKPQDLRFATGKGEATETNVFLFYGEMCGAGDLQLQKLEEFAKDQDHIQIDMSKLRRMDFVCTGTFLNLLTGLRRNHKAVSIFGANQMLIALLGVMGIDSLVTMVKDKER